MHCIHTEYATPPGFSRSSSLSANRSSDTASPIYPERAIRPLPKNRLKSKLSPQQASSIIYPPDPPPISPALNLGGQEMASTASAKGRMTNGDAPHGHYQYHNPHHHQEAPSHGHCTCGGEGDSGDEEVEFDHPVYRYPTAAGEGQDKVLDKVHRRLMEATRTLSGKPAPVGSAASSADGYESFENTSNKKKRKIPLSTQSSLHQSQLSAEMASMGISGGMDGTNHEVGVVTQHAYAPVSQGTGISGAGRGRYGRQSGRADVAVRRPLGCSSANFVNTGPSARPAAGKAVGQVKNGVGECKVHLRHFISLKPGADLYPFTPEAGIENTGGIISQAIKSAAEQGPLTPHKAGLENSSLLHSVASPSASTPATNNKTQFTFTMESESANKLVDQQAAAAAAAAAYNTPTPNHRPAPGKPMHTTGTQTTPSLRQPAPGQGQQTQPRAGPSQPQHAAQPHQQQQPAQPKPRRRPSKEYALAARQRRLQQEYANYHHRPTKDTMWICEFCEYEDIFGYPPVQLIREYERKDRAERKRLAEKRRLLEKAKAKGRKGKKGGKKGGAAGGGANAAANANANANANAAVGGEKGYPNDPLAAQQPYDPALDPQGEEFFDDDDDFADEYDAVGPGEGGYEEQYYHPPIPALRAPAHSHAHAHAAGGGGGTGGGGGRKA